MLAAMMSYLFPSTAVLKATPREPLQQQHRPDMTKLSPREQEHVVLIRENLEVAIQVM